MMLALLTAAAEATHEVPAEAAHGAAHEAHGGPAQVLMHHVLDQPWAGLPSKHLAFFVLAALMVLLLVRVALRGYREGIPVGVRGAPGWWARLGSGVGTFVEMIVLFIRDDIAEKNIGHDGRKYASLLCSFFFFILIAALLGLTPGSATSTGNIAVTGGLAAVSFLAQMYAGIAKYGVVRHFLGIVPPGLPAWLLPIMIPVEILSMFTKPFALMVRLFANMLAGHMVIATLLLLVPLMAGVQAVFGWGMIPISLALGLFIMLLEVLVAFIQAYIFTLLTSIFIGMYAHPAH